MQEIWDVLRVAAEADLEFAQAIVDSAGVIVTIPDMTTCYDERGLSLDVNRTSNGNSIDEQRSDYRNQSPLLLPIIFLFIPSWLWNSWSSKFQARALRTSATDPIVSLLNCFSLRTARALLGILLSERLVLHGRIEMLN
ncbi:hypothetical protein ACLOJK_010675 [Asimina triloba]